MRYIEIDSIIEQIKAEHCERCTNHRCALCDIDEVLLLLEEADDADVEEVKHGYWIDKPTGRYLHMGSWCSVCQEKSGIGGIESNRHKPYCPNCGAKMDGEREEK
jgi:hypothetical protein